MEQQPDLFDSSIQARFERFHSENPRVFGLFVQFAEQAKAAGRAKIGAKAIAERIRWEVAIATRGDGFKLNNVLVSRYARLIAKERPDLASLFEIRTLKAN